MKKRYLKNKDRIGELKNHSLIDNVEIGIDQGVIHNGIEYNEIETIWLYTIEGYTFENDSGCCFCLSIREALEEINNIK